MRSRWPACSLMMPTHPITTAANLCQWPKTLSSTKMIAAQALHIQAFIHVCFTCVCRCCVHGHGGGQVWMVHATNHPLGHCRLLCWHWHVPAAAASDAAAYLIAMQTNVTRMTRVKVSVIYLLCSDHGYVYLIDLSNLPTSHYGAQAESGCAEGVLAASDQTGVRVLFWLYICCSACSSSFIPETTVMHQSCHE